MEFVIVTGMSGAGKSQVVKSMEDLGYYCVDNMPPQLLTKFVEMFLKQSKTDKIAVVMDLRSHDMLSDILDAIHDLKRYDCMHKIVFLESSDAVLVKRYKETRRPHPLQTESTTVLDAIKEEREKLAPLKVMASYIIDTSNFSPQQLKAQIASVFNVNNTYEGIATYLLSFGFKYGIPMDADLVFDVRFLPNPFYIAKLKKLSGMDKECSEYVLGFEQTKEFIKKLDEMLEFLLPHYAEEGKSQLIIGIGCTGGRHRSVAISNEIYQLLKEKKTNIYIIHRDKNKEG